VGRGHAHALHVHGHSVVHRLAPEVKIIAAITFVFAVAVTPRAAVPAFVVQAMAIAAVGRIAGVPLPFIAARMLILAPFLIAAAMLPFVASGERITVLGIPLAVEGLWGAWNVVAKATIGVSTSITLAATTEVPRLLRGLERLRVPAVLTQIATFMVRYLEVVAGEVARQRAAMLARAHDPRWLWQARAIATSAGALFVRSYERGERVHGAMLARGYTGTMPQPSGVADATPGQWLAAAALPAVGTAAALIGWMVTA